MQSTFDGLMIGLGFLLVLVCMGAILEILGQGTLFMNLGLLLNVPDMTIRFMDKGFLLLVMPPGAFLTLGCLIALKNVLSGRAQEPR